MNPGSGSNGPRGTNAPETGLVGDVLAGSVDAWHRFVDQYSGLIYRVVKRHLFAEGEDEVRNVYVDVLSDLHNGGLAKYGGRASLTTWLIVVTRAHTAEFMRRRYGRLRPPKGLKELSKVDREVLRLFYGERMSLEIVAHVLNSNGDSADADDIVASIQHIEDSIDPRYLKRLDDEHHVRQSHVESVNMLRFLTRLTSQYERRTQDSAPDAEMMAEEARSLAQRVRDLVEELPAEDREVVRSRFIEKKSARRVAKELGLDGPRKVYTIVDRAVRRLRRALGVSDAGKD